MGWLQFGIGTLLFVTLCVAGFFAGYRRGFYSGQEAKSRDAIYAKAYDVKDIISASPTASTAGATLTSYLEATIMPRSWAANGGPGALSYYETNHTIVISNNQEVHDQIADTLKQVRLLQQQGRAREAESILVSVGS